MMPDQRIKKQFVSEVACGEEMIVVSTSFQIGDRIEPKATLVRFVEIDAVVFEDPGAIRCAASRRVSEPHLLDIRRPEQSQQRLQGQRPAT